jgi:Undecaprenyl-phosphate glucose phosphotransferase
MTTAILTPHSPPDVDISAPASPPEAQRGDRRGPFRPAQLATARKRVSGRSLSRTYRFVDGLFIGGLGAVACAVANPAGVWASPVGDVIPFFAAAALLAGALETAGAYALRPRESFPAHLARLGLGFCVCGLALAALLLLARPPLAIERGLIGWFDLCLAGLCVLHVGWRSNVRRLRQAGRLTPNIVVVGATPNAQRLIARALESRDVAVLGVFDDRKGRVADSILGVPVLGDTAALVSHRIMPYVDQVVITVTATAQARVRGLVERLGVLPNEIMLFVDVGAASGEDASDAALSRILDAPLARLSGHRVDDGQTFAKRMQDLALGAVALAAALPVMAAVALAIRLDTPGPIFFRQRRHGFNNEEIVVWKFRSMHHDMRDDGALRQVERGDPRVTRVGRLIRAASLDELPQLFNVMAGEMSLVGPRPHSPTTKTGDVESARLVAQYAHRHRIKPGMTGWAAINGSLGAMETPEQVRRRVALDIDYIERQSFWLDLYIMLMTAPRLIGERRSTR